MADSRDDNRVPNIAGVSSTTFTGSVEPAVDPTSHGLIVKATNPGFNISAYDYVALATASTTDTWTFRTGGVSGTLVATVTITYTDSTKATISTVIKT